MKSKNEIINFKVYKYVVPNFLNVSALILVLFVTLALYIICLPLIWFTPIQKLFEPVENLIDKLT